MVQPARANRSAILPGMTLEVFTVPFVVERAPQPFIFLNKEDRPLRRDRELTVGRDDQELSPNREASR